MLLIAERQGDSTTKVRIRTISVLEIVGGIFGFALIGWVMVTNPIDIFTADKPMAIFALLRSDRS